jgi:hypothetical protein
MDPSWLMWSSLFSLIGFAVLVYGRRQRRGAPVLFGIALMVYPYFVSSVLAIVGIGVLLLVALVVGAQMEDRL